MDSFVRPMVDDDLDSADRIMRLAFGTFRGLADPSSAFGDAESIRTRFRAAPDCAWVAEVDGELVGSALAARWGSFAFFGPLTVHPDWWDRGVGSRLLAPVLEAFERWQVRQAGLFTFPSSPRHVGLYQKHGFWPRHLVAVLGRRVAPTAAAYGLLSQEPPARRADMLHELRQVTDAVFAGLDLEREVVAVATQGIGDTVVLQGEDGLDGMAVCHCGAGSEAQSGVCYVKFGAVRPGAGAADRFEGLLDACEAFASASGLQRVVTGVDTGRLDAYRRLLARGFRTDLLGLSMRTHPDRPGFDTPEHYVLDDLR